MQAQVDPYIALADKSLFLLFTGEKTRPGGLHRQLKVPAPVPYLVHPAETAFMEILLDGVLAETLADPAHLVQTKNHLPRLPFLLNLSLGLAQDSLIHPGHHRGIDGVLILHRFRLVLPAPGLDRCVPLVFSGHGVALRFIASFFP